MEFVFGLTVKAGVSENRIRMAKEEANRGRDIKLLPLQGVKKRRDSSPLKRCVGDHADLGCHPKVLRMLAKHADSRVLFTDTIFKINREGKPKERLVLLSGTAIYILKPETFKCSTRVGMAAISKVVLSKQADNFCLVSLAKDESKVVQGSTTNSTNDLLFMCTHKIEFVSALMQGAKASLSLDIPLEFADEMEYSFASVYERTVTFEENAELGSVHTHLSEPRLRQEMPTSSSTNELS